ncbi:MAG: carbonic anhydrase [Burkholderiales bacterium]
MKQLELSRRAVFRTACGGTLGLAAALGFGQASFAADGKKSSLSPDEALEKLKKGNADFLADKQSSAPKDHDRRLEIARGQAPFAVLVGCSDSRVPPEVLFGAGLGELFIVRNAGNVVDTAALGSIEYGVAVLGAPLLVVLGHERCGAVDAAVSVVKKNATYPGSIGKMIEPIVPAVLMAAATQGLKDEDLLDAAVRENVRRVVGRLRDSEPLLIDPIKSGKLKVVGARYDLDDGRVEFFA